MSIGRIKFHYSPPGEISEFGTWVIFHECWMYCNGGLLATIWQAATEWKNDRHLVG